MNQVAFLQLGSSKNRDSTVRKQIRRHRARSIQPLGKISGNFGPDLNGLIRSNRKSFEKTSPPFEADHFSLSDRWEYWLNGSSPQKDIVPMTKDHEGVFRGARISSLPINACNNIPFPMFYSCGKWQNNSFEIKGRQAKHDSEDGSVKSWP